jgi:ubiquitin-like protein Pup
MAKFIERSAHQHSSDRSGVFMAAGSDQKQKEKSKGGGDSGPEGGGGSSKKIAKKGEEIKEDMDSLLDEIDSVLEENAEEFVKNYVQRGGE